MILESVNRTTETFALHENGFIDGFFLDITDNGTVFESWLYHEDYGIKTMLFGVSKEETTQEEFERLVQANLPHYIADYIDDYMGDDYL